jgi:type I restriction enzyme S subunit
MSEWKQVKLKTVCSDISYGYTASASKEKVGPKFLRITDITSGKINWDTVPYCRISEKDYHKYKLSIGDIVIARTGTLGSSAIIKNDIDAVFASYLIRFRIDEKLADPFFISYVLQSQDFKEYVNAVNSGSVQPGTNARQLGDYELPLPPLPEQKAIAEVLSSIDDKIELLHRQNKTLEEMAMTLFRQWFIEPTKDGLPEGWEEVSLGDVFDYLEGPGIRNWQYSTKGIPFLNIRLIENGEINIKNANFISEEEAFGKYKKFLLQEGDVVISTSGTLGKYAIVRKYHLPLLLNTSIIRFRPKNKNYRIFMYLYLKSREFKEYLESSADGSVQANFGPTHLRTIKIIIPPNHTLEKFENAISPFYERLNNNYSQIQTLEKLRNTLLPKLMSGEIRVKI